MYVCKPFAKDFGIITAEIFSPQRVAVLPSAANALETAKLVLRDAGISESAARDLCLEVSSDIVLAQEIKKFDTSLKSVFRKRMRQSFQSTTNRAGVICDELSVLELKSIVSSYSVDLKMLETQDDDQRDREVEFMAAWEAGPGRILRAILTVRLDKHSKADAIFKVSQYDEPIADFTAAFLLARPPWAASRMRQPFEWRRLLDEPLSVVSCVAEAFRSAIRYDD